MSTTDRIIVIINVSHLSFRFGEFLGGGYDGSEAVIDLIIRQLVSKTRKVLLEFTHALFVVRQ